jgi:anaerobic selenocysteine-containing dehydrogenase
MTKRITRRQFIQAAGLTGATMAVSGCTINLQKAEKLEPYVVPPEEALPGENIWYASACRQCPAGCGILVRVSNGRAHKIEGNPEHPLNRGKLCARGQAGLQLLYNPDRLRNAVRQGQRGSRKFEPLAWETALGQLADRVKAAKPGAVAFYGNFTSDSLAAVVGPLLKALAAPAAVWYDPLVAFEGRGALAKTTGQYFGSGPNLPFFDLANSDVVFSFGANFAETWSSPVAYSRGFGAMRGAALGKRGYLVQFEPRLSSTGAVADEWIPIAPGTEGLAALAIGKIMVDLGLGKAKDSPAAVQFKTVDVKGIAAASGIAVEKLQSLAELFARFPHPTAIPGGSLSGHTNAPAAMAAVLALNALAGRADQDGAFHLSAPAPDAAFAAASPSTFADVQALIKRMQGGGVDVLLVAGNPLYELPIATKFAEALAAVPFVVSFSPLVDETAVQADLILPDHSYLESWGYQITAPAGDRPAISSRQPVVAPLYDTRATSDVILDLASRLGGAAKQALPWPNTVAFLKEVTAKLVGKDAGFNVKNADKAWAGWRQVGGWWPTADATVAPKATAALAQRFEVAQPRFDGDNTVYPFLLYPYPSAALSDGRGASQPWLQETPDPMTTASWDTWVEINPRTAKELGLKTDDVVKVVSAQSEIEAIVYVYPGIRPDVVAVPLGQGHSSYGRYANNKGANVLALLASLTDGGELAWAATRVKIEKTTRARVLPRIESNVGVDTANAEKHIPGW